MLGIIVLLMLLVVGVNDMSADVEAIQADLHFFCLHGYTSAIARPLEASVSTLAHVPRNYEGIPGCIRSGRVSIVAHNRKRNQSGLPSMYVCPWTCDLPL